MSSAGSQVTTTGSGATSPSVLVLGWWSRWKTAFKREEGPSWNMSERPLKETGGHVMLRVCMGTETDRANSGIKMTWIWRFMRKMSGTILYFNKHAKVSIRSKSKLDFIHIQLLVQARISLSNYLM